jgi:hypothetical protein
MKSQGKKEIKEAVVVAALCATVTGLVGIGIEYLRRRVFTEKKPEKTEKS